MLSYNLIQEKSYNKLKELQVKIRNLIAVKTSLEDLSANDAKLIEVLESENIILKAKIDIKELEHLKAAVSKLQKEKDELMEEKKIVKDYIINIKNNSLDEKEIEELKKINKDLQMELMEVKRIREENNRQAVIIKKLEDEGKQLKTELEQVNNKLRKVLEESEKQILELRGKGYNLEQQLTETKDLKSRLNLLKTENEELKAKYDEERKASNKEINELVKEVNYFEDKIKENEDIHNKEVKELRENFIKQAEEYLKLKKEYEDNNELVSTLQIKLKESEDAYKINIKDLMMKLKESIEENEKIKEERHNIEVEAQSLKEEHKKQIEELNTKHHKESNEMKNQYESAIEANNKQINNLKQELKDIEEENIKKLKEQKIAENSILHSSELRICFSELNNSKSEQISFEFFNDKEKLKETEKTKEMYKAKYLEKIEELKKLKKKAEKLWQDVERRNKRKHELGVKAMQRLEEEILRLRNENAEILVRYKEVFMEYNKVKNQTNALCYKIDFLESRCKHLNEQIMSRCEQSIITISQSEYENYMQRIKYLEKKWEESKDQLIKKEYQLLESHNWQEEYKKTYGEKLVNTQSELSNKEQQIEILKRQLDQIERVKSMVSSESTKVEEKF